MMIQILLPAALATSAVRAPTGPPIPVGFCHSRFVVLADLSRHDGPPPNDVTVPPGAVLYHVSVDEVFSAYTDSYVPAQFHAMDRAGDGETPLAPGRYLLMRTIDTYWGWGDNEPMYLVDGAGARWTIPEGGFHSYEVARRNGWPYRVETPFEDLVRGSAASRPS